MTPGFETLDLKAALHICENMRESDAESIRIMTGGFGVNSFAINRWQTEGAAFAFYQDGIPVCMGGLALSTPWSAVAWMVSTEGISDDSWKKIIRFSRKVLGNAALKYRRIDAACLGTWPAANRYAKKMGFSRPVERLNAGRDGQTIYEYTILGVGQ